MNNQLNFETILFIRQLNIGKKIQNQRFFLNFPKQNRSQMGEKCKINQNLRHKFNKQDKEINHHKQTEGNSINRNSTSQFHSSHLILVQMNEPASKTKLSEQQFEDKLNLIVKILKLKQQICLETIEHLQTILVNSQQLSTQMFLHDEMSKHKLFLDKMSKKFEDSKIKEKTLQFFASNSHELNESQKSLVRRVSARILELFQSFNQKVQKYNNFQKETSVHYRLIKPKFLRQIGQVDKNGSSMICIFQMCTMFFSYLESKFNDQCRKLNRIIELIENGEIHQIGSAFVCEHCKQLQKKPTPKAETKSPKNVASSKNLQCKLGQQQELRYFSKEKEKITEKLKIMRQQAKNKQQIKKQKTKFANKYYTLYQSAMDIHKGHLVEELTFIDQKEQRQKMMTEIQSRNKYNSAFIKEYINTCEEKNMLEKTHLKQNIYTEKTSQEAQPFETQQSTSPIVSPIYQNVKIFDNVIEKDINDVSISYSNPYSDTPASLLRELNQAPKSHTIAIQSEERTQIKSFRITNPNRKSNIPTPKSNPNLFSIKEIGPISQSYNFVKINMKNGHNQRARLPDISNRLFSMDQKQKSAKMIDRPQSFGGSNNLLILKTSLNKPKDLKKEERRLKVEQNNRVENINTKNTDKIEKKGSQLVTNGIAKNNKIKRSESGHKLVLENNEKGSIKSLEVNYSSSISKKIKKFCEVVSVKEVHL